MSKEGLQKEEMQAALHQKPIFYKKQRGVL